MPGRATALLLAASSLAGAVAMAATGPGAVAAGGPCDQAQVLDGRRGTWTILPGPKFPAGEQRIAAHAVDTFSPLWHFATNGKAIMRSLNGGCTWSEVYRLPATLGDDGPAPVALARIAQVAANDGVVVATIEAERPALEALNGAPGVATVVVRSLDGGNAFAPSATPVLPGIPGPIAFGAHGADVRVAAGNVVFASADGATTLTPTAPIGDATSIEHLAVPIVAGGVMWAKAANGPAFRTLDGGTTWRRYGGPGAPGTRAFAGPALESVDDLRRLRLTFFARDEESGAITGLIHSTDNGETFAPVDRAATQGLEGRIESFDADQRRGELVVTTADPRGAVGTYVWQAKRNRLVSIDEFALGPLRGAQAEDIYRERPRFYFFDDDEVFTYEAPAGGTAAIPLPGGPDYENPDPAAARLEPAGGEVRVPAGGERRIPYQLTLPERSARLDTFFLLDTSNSTEGYINGLRVGVSRIARSLAAAGVEARFGVGEYQDWSAPGYVRYARRADIGPADQLRSALSRMTPAGGEEPGYTAVDQAIAGTGIPAPAHGAPVAPGQSATWRSKALRTVVLIADESFAADPDGATRDEAVAALKRSGAGFVGVVVHDPQAAALAAGEDPPRCDEVIRTPQLSSGGALGEARLRCQLEDLAEAAGTRAPAGGADCDGDGDADVEAGRPLVCVISGERSQGVVSVAEPLRRLLLAVTEEQPVVLAPARAPRPRVEIVPDGDYGRLDLKKRQGLGFAVAFRCPAGMAGRRFRVPLMATAGGREVARALPTVACVAPAAARAPAPGKPRAKPVKAATPPAPVVAAPVAPVPVAAAPVPAPAPAPVVPAVAVPVTLPPPAPVPASAPAPAAAAAVAARPAHVESPARVRVDEDPASAAELHFATATAPAHDPWPARLVALAGLFLAAALRPGGARRAPAPQLARVSASPVTTPTRRRRRHRRS